MTRFPRRNLQDGVTIPIRGSGSELHLPHAVASDVSPVLGYALPLLY